MTNETEKRIAALEKRVAKQDQLIDLLVAYVNTISPVEPAELMMRRKAAETLIFWTHLINNTESKS